MGGSVRRRGMARRKPAARLSRELRLSHQQRRTLRRRTQARLNATEPTAVTTGTAFEADELHQKAGQKVSAPAPLTCQSVERA
jgi:hypothetical protein